MDRKLRDTARLLRKQATPAERKLWEKLRKRRLGGERFRRQYGVGSFILDFYCPARQLGIEIDGGGHSELEQYVRDSHRDRYLKDHGIRVLRFWNSQIERGMEEVLDEILRVIEMRR